MLTKSDTSAVLGWAIASIILIGSVFMVRVLMKIHDREIERLVQERDLLQKKLLASPGEHL